MDSPALLTFPSDVPFRRQLQPPGARRHPGKLHLGFLAYLLDREAPRGGRLLDPFGGSGGLLLACLPPWGCDVLLNELEPQWVDQCREAWAWMQASPAQPTGTAEIRCGDARTLLAAPFAALVTSPPWTHMVGGKGLEAIARGSHLVNWRGGFDGVVTSPPFQDALSHQRHGPDYHPERLNLYVPSASSRAAQRRGYDPPADGAPAPGARNPAQIGNLAGARYWAAMAAVWAACVPLVVPGGRLVVVLKNIVRGNREVDLIGGTRAQLEALGCRYVTTYYRAVAPGPFHAIRKKSNPDALIIDREGALVMERL